ncbi:MAG: hypothetical protein EZS28_000828, partial [Streblomastix strix]
ESANIPNTEEFGQNEVSQTPKDPQENKWSYGGLINRLSSRQQTPVAKQSSRQNQPDTPLSHQIDDQKSQLQSGRRPDSPSHNSHLTNSHQYRSPVQRQSSPLLIKESMNKESFRSVSPVSSKVLPSQHQYRSPKPQSLKAPPLVIKDNMKKAINNPQDSLHKGNSQVNSQQQKSSRSPSSSYLNPKQIQQPPLIVSSMKKPVSSSSDSYMIPLIDISQEEFQSPS